MKDYDVIIHYHQGKANIVVVALSRKSRGSLATLITQPPNLLKDSERMQLEVRVKEPTNVLNQLNQVSVQFDLYERIKRSQQNGDKIIETSEKV